MRFRFDWDKNKELIEATSPDVVFCHQIEQCASIRALLETLDLSRKIKLVTYYHYLPALELNGETVVWDPSLNHSELAEVILFNVFAALKSSDVFFVTSQYSRNFLIQLASNYNFIFDTEKIVIMPPPADPFFETSALAKFNPDSKTILYSSRLYEQYGTDFLIDVINHFKGSDVSFLVTDFFANKSSERKKLDARTEKYRDFLTEHENVVVRDDGDNRYTYRDEIIYGSSLIFGPYRKNANWSMGMIDAFMMGVPGIGPNFASFPEFMPSCLIYTNRNEAISLIDKLLIDRKFWEDSAVACRANYGAFMPSKIADTFLRALL